MTTIYKVSYQAYDYWFQTDRDGFQTVEKYFTSKKKAEAYVKEVQENKYIYQGWNKDQKTAEKDYQNPYGFAIEKITVE